MKPAGEAEEASVDSTVRRQSGWVRCGVAVLALVLSLGGCDSLRSTRHGPLIDAAEEPGQPAPTVTKAAAAPSTEIGDATIKPSIAAAPQIYRGSGFVAAASNGDTIVDGEGGGITLNFVNADIREVIDAILGDMLRQAYVIDPRVQGTVTVRTSRPLKTEDILPVLEDVLTMNGAALVKSGEAYRIVPLDQATSFRIQPGFGVHIIPLKYAAAEAVRGAVEPFVPPGRTLRTDVARNLLIFTGTGAEAHDLEELIQVFDVDWMAGMSFAIFPLQSTEAKKVVEELNQVFGQNFDSPLSDIVQFVPIERQNSILVITPQAAYLDKAAAWIERLDRGEGNVDQRIYVYLVQNGRAKDIAAVLAEVFGATTGGAGGLGPEGVAPGLAPMEMTGYPRSGTPELKSGTQRELRSGSETQGELRSGTQAAPAPAEPARTADVAAPGENVAAEPAVASAAESVVGPGAGEGISVGAEEGIRIVADERNNALVIRATPVQFRMIEAALKQLDLVPLQVLIEATIAEVTLNDQLKYGLQWFFVNGDFTLSFSDAALIPAAVVPGFNFLATPSDARIVLSALSSITDVRVISSPQLMVLDNESARLQVGDQVPIATQSAVSVTDPEAPIVNSIEYRDTGVILDIIPHVNASGLVVIDIIQEVSSVIETKTSGIDSPTIQQRQIESSVAVQSGETIALGGLIRDANSNDVSGIPLLSEIPILGNLFKTTDNKAQRTELLILLTPRVVRDSQDARDVTDELRGRFPALKPLELSIHRPQMPPTQQKQKQKQPQQEPQELPQPLPPQ